MEYLDEYLHWVYLGNTVEKYLMALGGAAAAILFINLFQRFILTRLKNWATKTRTQLDDYILEALRQFVLPLLKFTAIYIAITSLKLSPSMAGLVKKASIVVITFYAIRIIIRFLRISLESHVRQREGGEEKVGQLRGILALINMVIWCLGVVFLLDKLGYNVKAIVTGLGIGGLAVALAAQTILGDLFNYFVIFFDRPFEVGDVIDVDSYRGQVEYIGIKTTRIRSLSGEQVIISNSNLTSSRVRNFKRMERRRVVNTLTLTYQTSLENLKAAPELVEGIIGRQQNAEAYLCRFSAFGDFSLNFELIYYINSGDYLEYMNIQQAINLAIFEAFNARGIEFAYPTQTLFIEKGNRCATGCPVDQSSAPN